MKSKLKEYQLSEADSEIIFDEFARTQDQYYIQGVFANRPRYMSFTDIIKIIAEKNGIKLIT